MHHRLVAVAALAGLFAGCAAPPFGPESGRDVMLVPADGLVELALDGDGRIVAVEYHCRPDDVPQAVMRVVEAVLPGGEIVDCEKEYRGGELFFEVKKIVDGRGVEIMVAPDGRIDGREVEVPASSVPDAVIEGAARAVPGGERSLVEELRDGANNLVEYHVKSKRAGIAYKCVLTPAGKVVRLLRETPAEVEVPVGR